MYITGVGTSTPPWKYSKSDCWEAFEHSEWFGLLEPRARMVAQMVLQRENGIEYRHIAVDSLAKIFSIDPNTLHERFLAFAPALAENAARGAIAEAFISPEQIGAVIVSTCTGYLCPGLSGYVVERLGLKPSVEAYDLVGQGCAAALPNLKLGQALIASGQHEHVLSICVEVSSAAMYLDNDPGVLISACLFGDGAGAAVLSAVSRKAGRDIEWMDCASLTVPEAREALMFEHRDGMLRNILTRRVPELAAQYALKVLEIVLERRGIDQGQIENWLMHAGGRDVLLALERRLDLQPDALRYSSRMLRAYGNLSSAFVYFVILDALRDEAAGGYWWLSSFGAGFSCHGALLSVH